MSKALEKVPPGLQHSMRTFEQLVMSFNDYIIVEQLDAGEVVGSNTNTFVLVGCFMRDYKHMFMTDPEMQRPCQILHRLCS